MQDTHFTRGDCDKSWRAAEEAEIIVDNVLVSVGNEGLSQAGAQPIFV